MNYPKIIIYDNNQLFNILNEISEQVQLKFLNIEKNKLDLKSHKDYFILASEKITNYNYLFIDKFPIEINKLIQLINTSILRKSYEEKSQILIGNYILDINSKSISNKKKNIKLTEKEIEIISFLNDKKKSSVSIKELEKSVWNYTKDVETHTVETHIHRLKKKFKVSFNDDKFIKSKNNGYKLN